MAPEEKRKSATVKAELASLYGGNSDQLIVIAAFECWKRAKDNGQEAQFCSRLLPPLKNNQRAIVETTSGAKVRLHPHSSNFKLSFSKSSSCPLVIYDEITRGDGGMHIKNCTVVGPYPLLLLATDQMVVAPPDDDDDDSDNNVEEDDEMEIGASASGQHEQIMSSPDNMVAVVVDRWLKFESTALDVAQIYCLRERLSAAVLFKVKHPRKVLPPVLGASVYAIACILSYDGLSGISLAENVDSLTTMVNAAGIDCSIPERKFRYPNSSNNYLRSLLSDDRSQYPSHKTRTSQNGQQQNESFRHSNLQVGKDPYQRNPLQGPNPGGPTTLLSRGDSFKRRRGSGPR